jgi:hypothetical protein
MGCLMSGGLGQEWRQSGMVVPVPIKNPGIYVARVVSNGFVRTHQSFRMLSDAHHTSLDKVEGVP